MAEKQLEEMTSAELKEIRAGLDRKEVDPNAWDQLNDLIADKIADEKVEARLKARDRAGKSKEWDDKAYKRWPALKDEDSEFAKRVLAAIEEAEDKREPKLMYHVANEIGEQLGLLPDGFKPSRDVISRIKPSGHEDGDGEDSGAKYTDQHAKLLERFTRNGLLDGKDEKVVARINAKAEEKNDG